MKNENDQHSSSLRSNQPNRKFEILRAEIILFSPKQSSRDFLENEGESISFSSEKILDFKLSTKPTKRHLRLIKSDEYQENNILLFQ